MGARIKSWRQFFKSSGNFKEISWVAKEARACAREETKRYLRRQMAFFMGPVYGKREMKTSGTRGERQGRWVKPRELGR